MFFSSEKRQELHMCQPDYLHLNKGFVLQTIILPITNGCSLLIKLKDTKHSNQTAEGTLSCIRPTNFLSIILLRC